MRLYIVGRLHCIELPNLSSSTDGCTELVTYQQSALFMPSRDRLKVCMNFIGKLSIIYTYKQDCLDHMPCKDHLFLGLSAPSTSKRMLFSIKALPCINCILPPVSCILGTWSEFKH